MATWEKSVSEDFDAWYYSDGDSLIKVRRLTKILQLSENDTRYRSSSFDRIDSARSNLINAPRYTNTQRRNKRSPRGGAEAAFSSLTHTSSATLNESGVHISARNNLRGVFSRGSIYLRGNAMERGREGEGERTVLWREPFSVSK